MGFNLFVLDTVHKMRDDMRTVKIRTGKIIHLLDSVLNAKATQQALREEEFQETENDKSYFDVKKPPGSETKQNYSSLFRSLGSMLLPVGSDADAASSSQGQDQLNKERISDAGAHKSKSVTDDAAIDAILSKLRTQIPKV